MYKKDYTVKFNPKPLFKFNGKLLAKESTS